MSGVSVKTAGQILLEVIGENRERDAVVTEAAVAGMVFGWREYGRWLDVLERGRTVAAYLQAGKERCLCGRDGCTANR